jgi:multidrug efflux pump subunit AcrB
VGIGIFQAPGSNALQLSTTVRATMEELKKNFPQGVDYRIVYDPTVNVRDGIHEVVKTLFEAILLVVLVVCCSSRPGAPRSSRWWRCRSRSSAPSP